MPNAFKFAFRRLTRSPGFAGMALLTLALCIGANLTIFSVVNSVLLAPLPFPSSDRIAILYNSYPKAGVPRVGASLTSYYERRGKIEAFASLGSLGYATSAIGEPGSIEHVEVGRVTPDFFSTLGVSPALGRAFTDAEMTYNTDKVAVLSDGYWRQHYNADPK